MKCPSCGYYHEVKSVLVEEVVKFKSGPRKGEIKGTEHRSVELKIGDLPFYRKNLTPSLAESCWVLICPECKTLTYDEY